MEDPFATFRENVRQVAQLVDIHTAHTGIRPGRRHKVEVLNKSAIVLLVACWEAFVEDCASTAVSHLVARCADWNSLPSSIRRGASLMLKEDKNEISCWRMAGEGWKDVVYEFKTVLLRRHLGAFNTPKAGNIDDLFRNLFEIPRISDGWHWNGTSTRQAREKLEECVVLRGAIAHRVEATTPVLKKDVRGFLWFIMRLAVRTGNDLRVKVEASCGAAPWGRYTLGNTS